MPTQVQVGEETVGVAGKDDVLGLKDSKENSAPVDLPQDYLPFSPPAADGASPRETSSNGSPVGDDFAANAHTWVSPNKSDEVPSSKESSPDGEDENLKESISSAKELEAEYEEADFEAVATVEESSDMNLFVDLNLSVEGQRLETQNAEFASIAEHEAVLDASGKDFVKIIHGDKEVMLVLPSGVSCDLGSTLELSETLAASLGITDEIVGLKTTALVLDGESSTFQHHGDCVVPFSALASGQLSRMLKNAGGTEGVPSFNLVTSNFDSYLESYQLAASVEDSEEASQSDDSSMRSGQEGSLHSEAFVELMEKSDEFDPFEKNSLLRFGIDNAEQGNVLYRASFRLAVYTGDMSYFVQGLKTIAKILLDVKSFDQDEDSVADPKQTSMTIFGLNDFVISADELFESTDLTAQQYATLLNAIFTGHTSVQSLFDLYHNPDFLIACDSDEDLRSSLCLRDLLHLGKKLEPMQPQSSQDDGLLKWAIKAGIHNFASSLPSEMPQEFVNIIYHMFSSGDDMVLAACQKFVDTDDSDAVEEMLLREYQIFCRNKTPPRSSEEYTEGQVLAEESFSFAKVSDDKEDGTFPDCLLTAVACLENDIGEDAAATILASYANGNQLLHDIYDHFIEFGGVDDFLSMLKVVASTDTDQFGTSRMSAAASASTDIDSVCEDATKSVGDENAFQSALDEMKEGGLFGQVEIAALRLAAARTDDALTQALTKYRTGDMNSMSFKHALLDVVDRVIQEIDTDL